MAGLIAYFGKHFDMVRCANRFENWTNSSQLCYRNVTTNLASSYESHGEPIRFIAEVQFHFRDFFPLGKLLHKTYEVCRAKSCWELAGRAYGATVSVPAHTNADADNTGWGAK